MKTLYTRFAYIVSFVVLAVAQTLPASAAVAPNLGAAGSFAILATTYTNGAGMTTLHGDLGYTTGSANVPSFTSGTNHTNDSTTASARTAQNALLADINSRTCDTTSALTTIDATPITPGVHCFTAAVSQAASTKITLNGSGVYIFKITGALTLGASSIVELTGGANAADIYWAPVGAATIGASAIFKGTIIAPAGITLGATVDMEGRLLASGGTATTDTDTINAVTVVPPPPLPPVAPAVTLLTPNGGENLTGNSVSRIAWSSVGSGIVSYRVSFSTNNGVSWTFANASTTNSFYDWSVPNISTTTARVRVEGLNNLGSTLASDDSNANFTMTPGVAVRAEGSDTSSSGPAALTRVEASGRLPPSAQVDSLVKLADDHDPKTEVDSTVYYIGLDAKRHPFISASAYMTWYTDFSGVTVVSASTLSSIPLGAPVLVRPGTRWVKIQSDPKTYYVEPGYKLRWVKDEAAAQKLGGPYWNKNIVDVDVSFFVLFSQGADIDTSYLASSWPAGTVVDSSVNILDNRSLPGLRYYISGGMKRAFFPASASDANHFQSRFSWNNQIDADSMSTLRSLPSGPDITGGEDGLFSLLH